MIVHGYAELYLGARWVHVSPAYDLETCREKGFVPVDFDGQNDAKDSPYDVKGEVHIVHVKDHGHFEDFPLDYLVECCKNWVAGRGEDWSAFTDKVINHTVD